MSKAYTFIFALGGDVAWSGDSRETIIKQRATKVEQSGIKLWMESCKPGWHKKIEAGIIVCTGEN